MQLLSSLKTVYRKLFPPFQVYLAKELKGCESVLELGCGRDSPLKFIDVPLKVGVDIFEPSIRESRKKGIHHEYVVADIRTFNPEKKFDAVVALDVIEHLEKSEGLELLRRMESMATKKIVIYTPNGFLRQGEFENNPAQVHRSGWNVKEMRRFGFVVYGIHGFRPLRKEMAEIRFRPKFFWSIISDVTQKITYHIPSLAFQFLCVKEVR